MAADWGTALHAGDELVVSHVDGPGLVVSPLNANEELWIPASLITNSAISRAWSFRPKKIDLNKIDKQNHKIEYDNNKIERGKFFLQTINSPVRVTVGDIARLSIEVLNIDVNSTVVWKKEKKDTGLFLNVDTDGRYKICQSAGLLYLEICHCRLDDAGTYECTVETEKDSLSVKIVLCITGNNFFYLFKTY